MLDSRKAFDRGSGTAALDVADLACPQELVVERVA